MLDRFSKNCVGRTGFEPVTSSVSGKSAEDNDGLGWSTLADARDAARVRPGVMLVAGNRHAQAVVRVVAVDLDGQVHFTVLPGLAGEEPPSYRPCPSLKANR
jgi:hypothetical protein